jgi:hypothetical protein
MRAPQMARRTLANGDIFLATSSAAAASADPLD